MKTSRSPLRRPRRSPTQRKPTPGKTNTRNPTPAPESGPRERLQKLLAAAGLGSRRQIETWIAAGRVKIGDRTATLGDQARATDEITVDGNPVRMRATAAPRVLMYHKPPGELVTRSDPEGRQTVFSNLPHASGGRWISIGRLDANTTGLLLLTDSGDLANQLMHPRYGFEREYAVRVLGELGAGERRRLLQGITLEDGRASFDLVEPLGRPRQPGINRWYKVVLREGRNREVRRLFAAVGLSVSRLVRVRFGALSLPRDLPAGHWLVLNDEQIRRLLERDSPA